MAEANSFYRRQIDIYRSPRPSIESPVSESRLAQFNGEWEFELITLPATKESCGQQRTLRENSRSVFVRERASGAKTTDFMHAYGTVGCVRSAETRKTSENTLWCFDYEITVYINVIARDARCGTRRFPLIFRHCSMVNSNVTVWPDDTVQVIPSGKQSERYASHGFFITNLGNLANR